MKMLSNAFTEHNFLSRDTLMEEEVNAVIKLIYLLIK